MNVKQLGVEIRNLIASDDLSTAIELLSKHFHHNEQLDTLILQAGRLSRLRKEERAGTIPKDEANQELNHLRQNILSFVRDMDSTDDIEVEIDPTQTRKAYLETFRLSQTRIAVAKSLLKYDSEGLTISQLMATTPLEMRKPFIIVLAEMLELDFVEKEKRDKNTYWKISAAGKLFFKALVF